MQHQVAILDYGSGNLRSAERALARHGVDPVLTSDPGEALEATALLVPGVGAFGACMDGLREIRGPEVIAQRAADQRPTLGICVGMQVMFAAGLEHGRYAGCGVWEGDVDTLRAPVLPHMGWSRVPDASGAMFAGIEGESFYFVHSYAAHSDVPGAINTHAHHGEDFLAAVQDGALWATQFHPEKSGDAGAQLLGNWLAQVH